MIKIANAFSINMINQFPCDVHFQEISKESAIELIQSNNSEIDSYIGHEDTAFVLSDELNISIPVKRQSLLLKKNEQMLVAQLIGDRLPEGTTKLPENFKFKYFLVKIL